MFQAASQLRLLTADRQLGCLDAACLRVRLPRSNCNRCGESCPRGALAIRDGQPQIVADCLGCGQCVAVCPTSALVLSGFGLPQIDPEESDPIWIDCWRVPRAESPPRAIRVPCLGGLTPGWLIVCLERAGRRPLRLLDRGACSTCPVGRGIERLRLDLDRLHQLASACGLVLDIAWLSRPSSKPLLPAIPHADHEQPLDRRAFFRRLGSRVVTGLAAGDASPGNPLPLRGTSQSSERLRLVQGFKRLARRTAQILPAELFPRIQLDACTGHGICAHICPTGALRQISDETGVHLVFDARCCIACSQCAQHCPEQALALLPTGGQGQPVILATRPGHRCPSCGQIHTRAPGLCPTCLKRAQLIHSASALFRRQASTTT